MVCTSLQRRTSLSTIFEEHGVSDTTKVSTLGILDKSEHTVNEYPLQLNTLFFETFFPPLCLKDHLSITSRALWYYEPIRS